MVKAKSMTIRGRDIAEEQKLFEIDEVAVPSLKERLFGGSTPIVSVVRKRLMRTANTMDD